MRNCDHCGVQLLLRTPPNVELCPTCQKAIADRLASFLHIKPNQSLVSPVILLWRFEDAPAEYRAISDAGGDEDWLALLPPMDCVPYWLERMDTNYEPQQYMIADGYRILIGSH